MNKPVILVTRPMKVGDPTEYTYKWGSKTVKTIKEYGLPVIDIQKNNVTYDNVSKYILQYQPRLYIHIGHGCPTSLQGQTECIITRRFSVDELLNMSNFKEIMLPVTHLTGCVNTCSTTPDICNPICSYDTNVQLLKGTIIYTIACYSAAQLGKCAVKYGSDCYVGYSNLMLFPVDDVHSEDMFGDVHVMFLKELLDGRTVREAAEKVSKYEDILIKFHKKTRWVSLPMLWNKINKRILGNSDVRLYQ